MDSWSGRSFVLPLVRVEKRNGLPHLVTIRVMPNEKGVVSLRDRIQLSAEPMSSVEVFRVAFAMATGMARAHKLLADLVHGDIKPENVLMVGEIAHMADFGLAKALRTPQRVA